MRANVVQLRVEAATRFRVSTVACALLALTGCVEVAAQEAQATLPIRARHIDVSREASNKSPHSEGDQALVEGWPLYRTERGQQAFNDAMATLKATEGADPGVPAFKGCARLDCNITLPSIGRDGWLAAGRIWVSPTEFVLVVHSPRHRDGEPYRRHGDKAMRYFVLHEFHNSTRNTDPFDTISSHSRSVFVPLYMSKEWTDPKGRRFVIVLQVAPYDVVSIHASNRGSAGPGIEVAKNYSDALEPLQEMAGILIATMIKAAAPQLQVVNHAGTEGLPMLNAYEQRLARLRARASTPSVALPFVPAPPPRVAMATARLEDLILPRGASPPIPIADRGIVPARSASLAAETVPVLIGPIRPAVRPAPRTEPALVAPIQPATRPASLPADATTR